MLRVCGIQTTDSLHLQLFYKTVKKSFIEGVLDFNYTFSAADFIYWVHDVIE